MESSRTEGSRAPSGEWDAMISCTFIGGCLVISFVSALSYEVARMRLRRLRYKAFLEAMVAHFILP